MIQERFMTRREKIEKMLALNPGDSFLAYGLALEMLKEGDTQAGIRQLESVVAHHPDYSAAYFQLAQTLAKEDRVDEAKHWATLGIDAANRVGDLHAAGEMEGFLVSLG
jgi:predicted Zn-dependent protease